jgi:hypothetical protein
MGIRRSIMRNPPNCRDNSSRNYQLYATRRNKVLNKIIHKTNHLYKSRREIVVPYPILIISIILFNPIKSFHINDLKTLPILSYAKSVTLIEKRKHNIIIVSFNDLGCYTEVRFSQIITLLFIFYFSTNQKDS